MKSTFWAISLLAVCGAAAASDWPHDTADRMGLPATTDGHLEVRVWLGGGIAHPFRLVRVWELLPGANANYGFAKIF